MSVVDVLLALAAIQTPPPIIAIPDAPARVPQIVVYEPGDARCEGETVTPVSLQPTIPDTSFGQASGEANHRLVRVEFEIDRSGRPISVSVADPALANSDIGPSLAASRFPSVARTGCQILVTARRYLPADLPADVAGFYAIVPSRSRKIDVREFAGPAETTCLTDRPNWLVRAQPNFDEIPADPGSISFTVIAFDVAENGEPNAIRTLHSSGNSALDRAGLEAIGKWRFRRGKQYRGCSYGYWRSGEAPLAPPPLESDSFGDQDTCPDKEFLDLPPLARFFPPAFNRRDIEGQALVRFDAATWGEIGEIEIVEAQPAAAFGEAAKRLLASTEMTESSSARTDCLMRVRFASSKRNRNPVENE